MHDVDIFCGQQADSIRHIGHLPCAKFEIHRICNELPRIAEQVVIFIKDTDGELAEQHLADRIGTKWTLIADSKVCSHIERRA